MSANETIVSAAGVYIDGMWSPTEQTFDVLDPASGRVMGRAPRGSERQIDEAVRSARRAFDQGPWRRTTPANRGAVLRRLHAELDRRKDRLRDLLVRSAGATFATHGVQLEKAFEQLAHYADLAERFAFEEPVRFDVVRGAQGPMLGNALVHRQPAGVCGLIPTWNFPFYITIQKLAPALVAGCTVVVKPSPLSPLIDLVVAEAVTECDLPPGVFNLVTGDDPKLGEALVEHPMVDRISYTGSVTTGKRILAAAAGTMKRVHLELGGKSAALVLDDADLDIVAPAVATPAFFHAGQGCALCTRVIVSRSNHDALVERIVGFLGARVRVGDPSDPTVLMGPVIREERRTAIEAMIEAGRREGAELVLGGGRPTGLDHGYFLEPTVFARVDNGMRIAREEIFGPVLAILPVADEEEALRIANDSSYGLSGSIHGRDTGRAIELAKRIRTGTVNINGGVNLVHAPFGGFKESGIGREGSRWAVDEFTELQTITWR